MNNIINREKALEWWRSLTPGEQRLTVIQNFPGKNFLAISMSSSRIQQMWEKINK